MGNGAIHGGMFKIYLPCPDSFIGNYILFWLPSSLSFSIATTYKQSKTKQKQIKPILQQCIIWIHYFILFYLIFCLWLPKFQYDSDLWNIGTLLPRHFHFCIFSAPYFICMNSVGLTYSVSHTCILKSINLQIIKQWTFSICFVISPVLKSILYILIFIYLCNFD